MKKRKDGVSREEFLEKSILIHKNIYDYSLVEYINTNSKVEIICSKHGVFTQTPHNHMQGKGCGSCRKENMVDRCKKLNEEKRRKNRDDFIMKVEKKFGKDTFDMSEVKYVNCREKVLIKCHTHGYLGRDGEGIAPRHLFNSIGCEKCHIRSKNEIHLFDLIEEHYPYIDIIPNDRSVLSGLEIDIYMTKINLGIEWNGIYWHSMPHKKQRDEVKKDMLGDNLIQVLDEGREDEEFVSHMFYTKIKPEIEKRLDSIKSDL